MNSNPRNWNDIPRAPRYLLYTVGLDGPCEPQPTLFTRYAGDKGTDDHGIAPSVCELSNSVPRGDSFSLLEVQTLMAFMAEESLHGFRPVIPVPVWTDEDVETHSQATVDELPWIKVRFTSECGEGSFSVLGTTLKEGTWSKALMGLGGWDTDDLGMACEIEVQLKEELSAGI